MSLPSTCVGLLAVCASLTPTAAQDAGRSRPAGPQEEVTTEVRDLADPAQRVRYLVSLTRDSRRAATARELLVGEPELDEPLRELARRSGSADRRSLAFAVLLERGAALPQLVDDVVADRSRAVRSAFVERLQTLGRTGAAVPELARHLVARKGALRVRACDALGELGDPAAIAPLRAALKAHGCACTGAAAPRAHAAFLTHTSFVRDYDVEIA